MKKTKQTKVIRICENLIDRIRKNWFFTGNNSDREIVEIILEDLIDSASFEYVNKIIYEAKKNNLYKVFQEKTRKGEKQSDIELWYASALEVIETESYREYNRYVKGE